MTRRWTGKELELLKTLYGEGKSIAYLSDILRRTPASIRMQASRLGIRRGITKGTCGEDLLADVVAVFRGESPPRDPRIRDLFDRLQQEHLEWLALVPRCDRHQKPLQPWCSECEREDREETREDEPLLDLDFEEFETGDVPPLPLPLDPPGTATQPHTGSLLLAPESLRSRSGWEGDPCGTCGRPTFAPRIYSTAKGAWFCPECWDERPRGINTSDESQSPT